MLALLIVAACGHSVTGELACDEAAGACCHANTECSSPTYLCLAPHEFAGCGACQIDDGCQADSDCGGSTMICELPACSCDSITKGCIGGCVDDSSCGLGQSCAADHRCRAKSCTTSAECPDYFTCGSTGTCARKNCQGDDDCGDGGCVNSHCYEKLGTCTSLPS